MYRTRVLNLLCLLGIITYLDRVCISVAGPRIQEALHIGPLGWGWVTGVFTIAYAIFEIPSGALGDRIGPRRVLTRIVLWWSAFTSLTGLATSYYPLLLTRFLFGMGEAGAYPNASIAVARWFPIHERGRAFGGLFDRLRLHVDAVDVSALARDPLRGGAPDTGRGSRDQHRPPVESPHVDGSSGAER